MDSKERYVGAMRELKEKLVEYPAKIKDLEVLVSKLEEEVSDFKIREVFTNNLLADMKKSLDQEKEENKLLEREINDLENKVDQMAYEAAKTIKQLKSENIDLMAQVVQEREQKEAYKEDSKQTLKANQELRKILKQNDRKLSAFRNALKECLL